MANLWHLNSPRNRSYDIGISTIAAAILGTFGVRASVESFLGAQVTLGTAGTTDTTVVIRRIRASTPTTLATITLGNGVLINQSTIDFKDGAELLQGDVIQAEVTAAGTSAKDLGVSVFTQVAKRA